MATRDIRTTQTDVHCDVCGRTLLRGERSETYVAGGGQRREVCDLCTPRAVHEGWIREDARLEPGRSTPAGERRRSLLGRFRARRPEGSDGHSADYAEPGAFEEPANGANGGHGPLDPGPAPDSGPASAPRPPPVRRAAREPRHVRAVPMSAEQKTAVALELFNESEHPRTIAGVARSLGAPSVAAHPLAHQPSTVTIVVGWELCWYRYEADLSDDGASVRPAGQGYELAELPPEDRVANAAADERGELRLGGD